MQQQMEFLFSEFEGLWRFRWISLSLAWLVALTGWAVIMLLPNSYEASARVYVDATSALRPLLQGLAVDTNVDAQLNFVRQAMLSRPQLEAVARKTDLDKSVRTPEQKQRLIDGLGNGISIVLASGPEKSADKLYTITYRDPHRETALAVVQMLLNTFVESSLGAGREGSETAQRFLREQIAEYERRLSEAESRLADFKRRNLGMMPGEQGDYFTRLQNEIDLSKKAQAALAIASNKREALTRQLRGEQPYVPGALPAGLGGGVGQSAMASDTTTRLKDAEGRLQEQLLRYTDKHPEVIALRSTIKQLQARQKEEAAALRRGDAGAAALSGLAANPVYQNAQMLLNQADVEVAALRAELNDRQARVAELQRLKNLAPEVEAEFARLNRDYGVTKSQYLALVDRLEKARLSEQASETGTVKFEIIDPPVAKFQPVAPNRPLLATSVFFAALAAGFGLAWLLHQMRPVFQSARRLAAVTGLPVLGIVSLTWQQQAQVEERRRLKLFTAAAAGLLVVYLAALAQSFNLVPLARLSG